MSSLDAIGLTADEIGPLPATVIDGGNFYWAEPTGMVKDGKQVYFLMTGPVLVDGTLEFDDATECDDFPEYEAILARALAARDAADTVRT